MDDANLGLAWPVKRSFILYVARMAEGQVHGGHGLTMRDASTFVFPADPSSDASTLLFGGELRLAAHAGALTLRLARPRIDLSGDRAVMSIDGQEAGQPMLPLVTFAAQEQAAAAGLRHWAGTDVRLCVEAVPLFGGYYGDGESFDDLSITIRPSRSS